MKVVSYNCPVRGCEFSWIPGTNFGKGAPVNIVVQSEKPVHGMKMSVTSQGPGCPKHLKRLVKHSERILLAK